MYAVALSYTKMLSLIAGLRLVARAPLLIAWKLASEENGVVSRPHPAESAEHAPALLLMNQIIPLTVIVTVPVAVPPPAFVTV